MIPRKLDIPAPLMLQRIMGSALLRWLVSSLVADGVGRFFLVCHDRYLAEAKRCFPADVELMTSMNQDAADLLHVFLSTSDDDGQDVIVVTGPAIYLKSAATMGTLARPVPSCVYAVGCATLMQALDDTERFSFMDFLHSRGVPYTDRDGVFAVSSGEELAGWQPGPPISTTFSSWSIPVWRFGTIPIVMWTPTYL